MLLPSSSGDTLVPLLTGPQRVCELLQRAALELGLGPQVGGEEAVGVGDSDEGSLEGVLEGLGGAGGGGVGILNTSELEESLDGGGGNETGTTGGGDELQSYMLACSIPSFFVFGRGDDHM